jgi:hypothetical protein
VRHAKQDGVSSEAVDAALRIRDRLGFAGEGTRGMYLCHTFCELGASSLHAVLDDIHDFLVAHPNEVLVVINQDYVTPADFVNAANDADLGGLVYDGPITDTEPTLRQMIDSNRRLVFLAENHAGGAPWYRLAYGSITEETPFKFTKVAQLNDSNQLAASCKPNRGPERAPLFLVNHWISTDPIPLPSDAAKVNAYDQLLARMRECQRIRTHLPNLVAVNGHDAGSGERAGQVPGVDEEPDAEHGQRQARDDRDDEHAQGARGGRDGGHQRLLGAVGMDAKVRRHWFARKVQWTGARPDQWVRPEWPESPRRAPRCRAGSRARRSGRSPAARSARPPSRCGSRP